MSRDELIDAGRQSLTEAWLRGVLLSQDEPGYKWHKDFGKFAATVLDAVEEKIRADEREKATPNADLIRAERKRRADLRDKVQALQQGSYLMNEHAYNALTEVLAFIDGDADA